MTFTTTANETMFTPNETPNAESIPTEATETHDIEVAADETRNDAGGLRQLALPGGSE